MKMKKYAFFIWTIVGYLFTCFVDMFFYKVPVIPHHGFEKYSVSEIGILYAIAFISMLLSIFVLKRDSFKKFVIALVIFCALNWVLNNLVDIPLWVSLKVEGYETFAFGVDFLRQDIWFFHDLGYFFGAIIAGIISLCKPISLKRNKNAECRLQPKNE